ncbi:hypothetical protein Tco_0278647 [Tanacetum coccineum]
MLAPSGGGLTLYQAYGNLYAMTGRKAHLLEDMQISSVGVFDEVFSTWMNFGGKTLAGDGIASIKRRRRDQSNDGVRIMAMASGCGRLKEDLELSTWRRRQDCKATPLGPRRQSTLVGLADVTLTISLLGEQCVCAKRVRSRTGGCPYNVDDYEKRHSGAEAKQRVGEQTGAARQVRRRARSGESVSDVYSSVNSGASDEIRKY